ncbi:MAG TPA: hypothetical protein VG889_15125 [Rhizomicrobium sp.]|nr:hypothetical protein [Rhizomicrobium sp.]
MERRKLIIGAAVAVLVLGPIYGSVSSRNFQSCEQHQGQYPTTQNNENELSPVLVPGPNSVRVFWSCSGGYANENGGAITALATVFLMILTGLLAYLARVQFVTSRTQLQAFVFSPQVRHFWNIDQTVTQPADPTQPRIIRSWEFRPVWQNSGETQTKNMTTHVEHEFRDSPLPENFLFRDSTAAFAKMLIGPKSSANGGVTRVFTIQELTQIQNGERFLYLWGWVRYNDVFPGTREHITRYCVQVLVIGDPKRSDCVFWFPFPNIGNCSDAECVAAGLG